MPCIILRSPIGERKVDQNENYRLLAGEQIVGVDWDCGKLEPSNFETEYWRQYKFKRCSKCRELGVFEST